MYGSDYIVYGAGPCPHCNARHQPERQIKETSFTRFRLLQFAAEMTAFDATGKSRARVDAAFSSARSAAGGMSKLNKQIQETRRAIENPAKAAFLDRNKSKLSELQSEYYKLDDAATAPLRDIRKSYDSRFPELKAKSPEASWRSNTRGADVKFMLGILVKGGKKTDTLISASGPGIFTDAFKAVAELKGYEICGEVEPSGQKSIADRVINAAEYNGTKRGSGYEAGKCAAPRLLAHALTKPEFKIAWRDWEMSEIFYFPNNDARREHEDASDKARQAHVAAFHKDQVGDPNCLECKRLDAIPVSSLYWVPGLSAHSCETCESLVPLLMCPNA